MKCLIALVMMGMLGAGCVLAQTGAAAGTVETAVATAATAPSTSMTMTDSQTLKAILEEMRGIHNDVRLSETTQILLTELEVQHGVVDKALDKRDSARTRMSSLQMNEKNFTAQEAQLEQNASSTLDPTQQKQIAQQEQMFKMNIANMKSQELDAANTLADAESSLRKEQDVLEAIQEQLDDVVKKLQPAR